MPFVDLDYEDRLIQRIEARRLIEARLQPRERAILCGYYRHGDTLREVGAVEGVGPERIRQIMKRALRRLQKPATLPLAPTRFDLRATPPPGFEAAEFLRHQQWLIERREAEARKRQAEEDERRRKREAWERNWQERERKNLDMIMSAEASMGLFDPPPPPKPKPPPKPPPPPPPAYVREREPWPPPMPAHVRRPQPWVFWNAPPGQTNVEPWFSAWNPPTLEHMHSIGRYAVDYFIAVRTPGKFGLPFIGTQAAHVECARNADSIAAGMQQLSREIPRAALFSAFALPIPLGMLGVTVVSPFVSLRLVSLHEGKRLSIEVTWDIPSLT